MTTTPEPADKLDATTNIAANGPTDGTLAPASEPYGAAATGPSPACLSRMLGNGHVLVLRGARHSNVPGLPGPCDSAEHAVRRFRFEGSCLLVRARQQTTRPQSSKGALQSLTPRSANHPSVVDWRIPIANRKRVADGLGRHTLIVPRRRLRQAGRDARSRNEPESGGVAQELASSGSATWLSAPARRSISSRLVMKPS